MNENNFSRLSWQLNQLLIVHIRHKLFTLYWTFVGDVILCGLRLRLTTSGSISSTAATSSVVFSRPSENRTRELARFFSTPIALMTCDGSSDPAEHAEPLEAQTPSISSPASKAMLSDPSTTNDTV